MKGQYAMIPGFDVEALNLTGKLISRLERFHLENAIPEPFDPRDLFDGGEQAFFRIQGIASFWQHTQGVDFGQYMTDLVVASHTQSHSDLTLIIIGKSQRIEVYISLGSENTTRTLLEGIFPGIDLQLVDTDYVSELLYPHLYASGIITGIPSRKAFSDRGGGDSYPAQNSSSAAYNQGASKSQAPLERVIRGMYGTKWAYVVQAHPRPRVKVVEERMKTIDLLTQITNRSSVQWSSAKNENLQKSVIDSGGLSQTYSGNMINYRAQYLNRLLEGQLQRLDQSMSGGQWLVRTYFGADTTANAQRLSSLLLGTLAGSESRPEPLRAKLTQRNGTSLEAFHTFLTSTEVGTLIQFPREEVPGYSIHDHVHFDSDFRSAAAEQLPLGVILHNGKPTTETYNIELNALTKHAVVIGVTGSGKTTTVMNLLDKVVDAQKPFLVIEPAKTEYRALHSTFTPRSTLRVYTLGNEMVAPFRLNPFEFETDDDPGSASLLTHIDFLKAVFNAAFPLYAPMPQVLETALHEIYEDRGWDLTSGINMRLPDWSKRHEIPIFPTMTDLYYKVEDVTNRLGYDKEVESNVKAALKSRVGSLRIGSKGLMLDTVRGIPMETLLSVPTILELENIGNDDEKTFIMGLFLARLYEFRRLQAATGHISPGIQHLIVFEEAHRLLKNTSTQVDGESSNPRAQAIEVFTNMLSEVRAYGQGVLVAEQIPSKLAPDVLKNTNMKIVHRLIAQDDRESIGKTMNLNQDQLMHLGILTPGTAAIFAEGADHAYLVRMENYKRNISPLTDRALKTMSSTYASVASFQSIIDINEYGLPGTFTGGPDPAIYQAAGKVLDSAKSRWVWSNVLLRLVANPANILDALLRFSEQIESEMSYLPADRHTEVLIMALIRGGAELLHLRGATFGWSYTEVEEQRVLLTHGLVGYIRLFSQMKQSYAEELIQEQAQAIGKVEDDLFQFSERYSRAMKRQQGPFAGCVHCPSRCLYRTDTKLLLTEKNSKWINDELVDSSYTSSSERYSSVAYAARSIAQSWLGMEVGSPATPYTTEIAYCAFLHTIASKNFSEYEQVILAESAKDYFFPQNTPNNNHYDNDGDDNDDDDLDFDNLNLDNLDFDDNHDNDDDDDDEDNDDDDDDDLDFDELNLNDLDDDDHDDDINLDLDDE
jgi:Helicase HerA, central domain